MMTDTSAVSNRQPKERRRRNRRPSKLRPRSRRTGRHLRSLLLPSKLRPMKLRLRSRRTGRHLRSLLLPSMERRTDCRPAIPSAVVPAAAFSLPTFHCRKSLILPASRQSSLGRGTHFRPDDKKEHKSVNRPHFHSPSSVYVLFQLRKPYREKSDLKYTHFCRHSCR